MAKRAAIFAAIWVIVTGADPEGFALGAATVLVATWLSLRLLPPLDRRVSVLAVLRLAPSFLWRSVMGGIDVAWRALSPRMPIAPGWKIVRCNLPAGPARAVLGGQFSLLPGTLVAGTRGDDLLVHVLDTDQDVEAEMVRAEAVLARTLDREQRG